MKHRSASGTLPFATRRAGTLVQLFLASALFAAGGCTPTTGDRNPGGSGGSSPGVGGSGGTGGTSGSGGSSGGSGGSAGSGGSGGSGGSSGGTTGNADGGGETGGSGGSSADGPSATGGSDGGSISVDTGASADAPPVIGGDPCAGTKFCEDWEKQAAGQAPTGMFTIQKGGYAQITVDTTRAYSGKQSVHFHMSNSPNDALMHLNFTGAPVFPLANNDLHGRVMLYLTRNPSRHWDLSTAYAAANVDDNSGGEQFSLSGSSPDNHVMSVHQPGDKSVDSSTIWPLNKWVCVQWEFAANINGKSHIQIKFDGQFIDSGMEAALANWKPPGFKSIFFGWKNFEGGITGDLEYWADDLAFGEKEIPCPTKQP
jgi:hypothetical protein